MGLVDDGLYQVKETSLDFGKIKTAALTMLNNRFSKTVKSNLFSINIICFTIDHLLLRQGGFALFFIKQCSP